MKTEMKQTLSISDKAVEEAKLYIQEVLGTPSAGEVAIDLSSYLIESLTIGELLFNLELLTAMVYLMKETGFSMVDIEFDENSNSLTGLFESNLLSSCEEEECEADPSALDLNYLEKGVIE